MICSMEIPIAFSFFAISRFSSAFPSAIPSIRPSIFPSNLAEFKTSFCIMIALIC